MPKLSEVATFNRKSLLNNYAELFNDPDFQGASIIEYPGDDYVKAASLVWCAMRAMAMRETDDNRMNGNGDRPGHILHNATMSDVIDLLWPTLPSNYKSRVSQGINKVFKTSGCALSVGRSKTDGRRGSTFDWWVADVWSIDPAFKLKASTREYKPRKKDADETKPDYADAFPEGPWEHITGTVVSVDKDSVTVQPDGGGESRKIYMPNHSVPVGSTTDVEFVGTELPFDPVTSEDSVDLATDDPEPSSAPIVVDDDKPHAKLLREIETQANSAETRAALAVGDLIDENRRLRKEVESYKTRISTMRNALMGDL